MERRFSSCERLVDCMICLMEARRSVCSRSDIEVRRDIPVAVVVVGTNVAWASSGSPSGSVVGGRKRGSERPLP